MNVLAIGHSCVSDVNQQLFVALSRPPDQASCRFEAVALERHGHFVKTW